MMDEKQLEQEYRNLKRQAAPDLWDRIEGNLKEHPERAGKKRFNRIYGIAAAAAAVLVLVTAAPVMWQLTGRPGMSGTEAVLSETAEAGNAVVTETGAAGEGVQEDVSGDVQETAALAGDAGGAVPEAVAEAAPEAVSGSGSAMKSADEAVPDRILQSEGPGRAVQLAHRPLTVPDQAVTVAEDARYFSEDILGDTELLCGGRIISAALQEDEAGRVSRVSYEVAVDGIYYAEDYVSSMDRITVESPIIRTEGDTAFVLYQMIPGETYLLALVQAGECYELLYPFAPQIQKIGNQGYLFHSGYTSLVNQDTSVAVKPSEGTNDYYYDRMLERDDDNFLSDLVSLIERETQGRK